MRRTLAAAIVAALLPVVVPLATAAAPAKARIEVVIKAPRGLMAQVQVAGGGTERQVLRDSSSPRTVRSRVAVAPGSYRITGEPSVLDGRVYAPVVSATSVRARRGEVRRVVVRWKVEKSLADVMVQGTTTDSVELRWRAAGRGSYLVRRATGDRAPGGPRDGELVARGREKSVTDSGLRPGTQYAYSVFVKDGRRWRGAASVATATIGTDPVTGLPTPSFSLAPHGVVVDPTDPDVVTVRDGAVWVTFARGRSAPVLGAGVALPTSSVLPGGYLGKVAEVTDARTARLVPGAMTDLFDSYDSSMDIAVGSEWMQTTAPAQLDRMSATSRRGLACKAAPEVQVELPQLVNKGGHFYFTIEKAWGVPHRVSYDFLAKPGFKLALGLHTTASLSCRLGLGGFRQQLTTWPVPLAMSWEAGAKVEVKGSVGLEASLTPYMEVSAKGALGSRAFGPQTEFRPGLETAAAPMASGSVTVSLGGELTVGPGIGNSYVGAIAGLSGELVPLSLGLGTTDRPGCSSLSLRGEANLSFRAEVWAGPLGTGVVRPIATSSWDWQPPASIPSGCGGTPTPTPTSTPTPTPTPTPSPTPTPTDPPPGDPTLPGWTPSTTVAARHPSGAPGFLTRVSGVTCPEAAPGWIIEVVSRWPAYDGGTWNSSSRAVVGTRPDALPGTYYPTIRCAAFTADTPAPRNIGGITVHSYTVPVQVVGPVPTLGYSPTVRAGGTLDVSDAVGCGVPGIALSGRVSLWDSATGRYTVSLRSFRTDAEGRWQGQIVVPETFPAGSYTLEAECSDSHWWDVQSYAVDYGRRTIQVTAP